MDHHAKIMDVILEASEEDADTSPRRPPARMARADVYVRIENADKEFALARVVQDETKSNGRLRGGKWG